MQHKKITKAEADAAVAGSTEITEAEWKSGGGVAYVYFSSSSEGEFAWAITREAGNETPSNFGERKVDFRR